MPRTEDQHTRLFNDRCWFLTGATASGKTEIGIKLCEMLDAEIVSLDSMAIYREMNIGTAKPTQEIRDYIPHHLLDIVDPVESFSVSQYRQRAIEVVTDILGRSKEVLFVGGTALYLKALVRGIFDGPPADWEFRNQVEAEIETAGIEALHERLKLVDPLSAHKLHPNDKRRMIRALEVFHITGKPISHWQNEFEEGREADECRVFSIRHEREALHKRIELRVRDMFKHGLVDEVKHLLDKWNSLSQTASQAVGYREVIEHLQTNCNLDETIEKVIARTRQFARHQETWFRGLSECRLVDIDSDFDAEEIAQQIYAVGQSVSANKN
jgi:tRNA dimethylallyltransferase